VLAEWKSLSLIGHCLETIFLAILYIDHKAYSRNVEIKVTEIVGINFDIKESARQVREIIDTAEKGTNAEEFPRFRVNCVRRSSPATNALRISIRLRNRF
jgi:hypothetical protein